MGREHVRPVHWDGSVVLAVRAEETNSFFPGETDLTLRLLDRGEGRLAGAGRIRVDISLTALCRDVTVVRCS